MAFADFEVWGVVVVGALRGEHVVDLLEADEFAAMRAVVEGFCEEIEGTGRGYAKVDERAGDG